MVRNSIVFVGALALLALSGCGDRGETGDARSISKGGGGQQAAAASKKGQTLADLPDSAVIIKIGDVKITKQDYRTYLKMTEALYKNRHPAYPMERLKAAAARHRMAALSEVMSRSLMKVAFGDVKGANKEAFRKDLQDQYVKTFCHRGQKFSDLRAAMFDEDLGTFFDKCFEEDLRVKSGMFAAHSNELVVTEADMQSAKKRVASYNARAAATNAIIQARMKAVVKKLAAGGDFAKLAKEYTMSKDDGEGGDMGECSLSDFSDESDTYKTAVAQLKTGDVSEVLETATGYDILKAVKYIPKDKSSDSPMWHLQRIQFEKPFFFEEQTDEELRKDLEKEKRDALLAELMPKLRDLAKIEFPYGREIFQGKKVVGKKSQPGRRPFPMKVKTQKGEAK